MLNGYKRTSLQLQATVGLLREESSKTKPGWADSGSSPATAEWPDPKGAIQECADFHHAVACRAVRGQGAGEVA